MSKVNTGLGKCYYAIATENGGNITYGEVKELGDLIEMSVSPSEENLYIYAANKVYDSINNFSGADITISMPEISDEAMCDLFGYKKATEGGIIYNSNTKRSFLALMFEQTNTNNITDYITLYKGQLNLAENKGKTMEEKAEFQTKQLSGKFIAPKNSVWMHIVSNNDADFNAETWKTKWGKEVIVPTVKTVGA
ncbi:MAG: hypothetical protein E6929_11575 [Clostridium sp.]|nr:hypothetical protein [Clostridium sp.]